MKRRYLLLGVATTIALGSFSKVLASPSDEALVRDMVTAAEQRSPSPVPFRVSRVSVIGSYALASVIYGETGGTYLLRKSGTNWRVIESSGGAYNVADMVRLGVPRATAVQLERLNRGQ